MLMQDVLEPSALVGGASVAGDRLCIDLIRRTLETDVVGFEIHLFDAIVSTSDVLRRLAEAGARDGAVVLAEAQHPACGDRPSLSASVLVRRRMPASDVPGVMFVAALALSEAMATEGIPAEARWPGSVVIGARKVAEVDATIAGSITMVDHVILGVHVGIGGSRDIDRNRFVARFLNRLERWLIVHTEHGPSAILAAWKAGRGTRGAGDPVTTY
jgi:biotin-(acetyl-CoA carboxylase) ligase